VSVQFTELWGNPLSGWVAAAWVDFHLIVPERHHLPEVILFSWMASLG